VKLISLNLWGGKLYEPLMEFVGRHAADTDIFCFQEMFFGSYAGESIHGARANLYAELERVLEGFTGYKRFAPDEACFYGTRPDAGTRLGQAIFARTSLTAIDQGGFHTYPEDSPVMRQPEVRLTGNFQYVRLRNESKKFLIGNLHGLWRRGTKLDTPERLEQSRMLNEFYERHSGERVLCGDFNLHPGTKSIAMLGGSMRDLVTESGTQSTRSSHYADEFRHHDPIADYAFVSPEVVVSKFAVLDDEVSDHLPLLLEFS
jgi:hypothetical protein